MHIFGKMTSCTGNSYTVSHLCELLYVSARHFLGQMSLNTEDSWMVSLRCELLNDYASRFLWQTILYTGRSWSICLCLYYELSYVYSSSVNYQTTLSIENSLEVSLHYEVSDDFQAHLNKKMVQHIVHISVTYLFHHLCFFWNWNLKKHFSRK